jgi:hypothetical protein
MGQKVETSKSGNVEKWERERIIYTYTLLHPYTFPLLSTFNNYDMDTNPRADIHIGY